jgi:hypothetical protein
MTLIETKVLGTAAASIEFTSIPQDGTDLVVLASLRASNNDAVSGLTFEFNNSTTDYSNRTLLGSGLFTGRGVDSGNYTDRRINTTNAATSTANTFSTHYVYVPNYTSSANKSFSAEGATETNSGYSELGIMANLWSNTAAITSIKLSVSSTLVAGSTVSLYKITKGSDGIVTTS